MRHGARQELKGANSGGGVETGFDGEYGRDSKGKFGAGCRGLSKEERNTLSRGFNAHL